MTGTSLACPGHPRGRAECGTSPAMTADAVPIANVYPPASAFTAAAPPARSSSPGRRRRRSRSLRRRSAGWSAGPAPCRRGAASRTRRRCGRRSGRGGVTPISSRNFGARSTRAVSTLTATTSNSGPPAAACSWSSAGISARHGTHQVAHRFSSTARPLKSASVSFLPVGAARTSAASPAAASWRR